MFGNFGDSRENLGKKVRENKKRKVGELVMTKGDRERPQSEGNQNYKLRRREFFRILKNINYDVSSSRAKAENSVALMRFRTITCSYDATQAIIFFPPE